MGDRVAVMKNGRIQQCAPPQELYDQPANVFVAGFIGGPKMNLAGSGQGGGIWAHLRSPSPVHTTSAPPPDWLIRVSTSANSCRTRWTTGCCWPSWRPTNSAVSVVS
jgi:ABC-type sulfate/molybdate transport systems ATPase subunit